MEEKDLGTIVVEQNGVKKECKVLFTFESEELGKKYIGYTDNSIASNGRKNIFVKAFNPITGVGFEDITDPDELAMINDVLIMIGKE